MEGAEFTENIINGVERPVKAAELFAFTLRVRAGNTDVLTDAEENVSVRSEERFSRNAETDLVCRLLLEKNNAQVLDHAEDLAQGHVAWDQLYLLGILLLEALPAL